MVVIQRNEIRDHIVAPEHTAYYYAKMILAEGAVAITEGTPRQIELAMQLRSDFISGINDADVREVMMWIERNELKTYRQEKAWNILAWDAVNRNTLRIINVASAKEIIDRLISNEGKMKQHDTHARYCKMARGEK